VDKQLHREHLEYGDIIQSSFYDTYRNLTYTTIMGYTWESIYCSNTNFILTTYVYVYVNTKGILRKVYINQAAVSVALILSYFI
jgi:hypothetical protein